MQKLACNKSAEIFGMLTSLNRQLVQYIYIYICGLTYVGKTTQCFAERIKQHVPAKLQDESPKLKIRKGDSAITKHLKSNPDCIPSSQATQERFSILATARCDDQLNTLEALFIRKLAPPLCNQKEQPKSLSMF